MKIRFFTLIELLLVVSVLAILMALLLPSLNRAKEMGRRMACLSNIRQIGLCWINYSVDNRGYLYPNTASGYGWRTGFYYSFEKLYNLKKPVMSCPSGVVRPDFYTSAHYSHNYDRLKNIDPGNGWIAYGLMARIRNPSVKLAFCDYGTDDNINTTYGGAGTAVVYINYIPGCGKWSPAAAKLANSFPGFSITDADKKDYLNDFISGRHLNSVSVLYADGHAASLSSKDIAPQYYPPGWGSLFNSWWQ